MYTDPRLCCMQSDILQILDSSSAVAPARLNALGGLGWAGGRLRTHFKKSQFIVVSLKEGMFNNANVLFRTKFVDGVSTVARTTPGVIPR